MQGNMNPPDETLKEVFDRLTEGVYFVDAERRITYWSKAAERITGFEADEVVGTFCMENILNHIDEEGRPLCIKGCPLVSAIENGDVTEERIYFHHKGGHQVPVHVRVTPVRDENGKVVGAIETFMEATSQVAMLERLNEYREMALIDPLTRLGNRRYTETAIERRLGELQRYEWDFGILFIDIDGFKEINDTHGHEAGDRVLQLVANTLLKGLRPFDFAGRWGGDEFVAVVANVTAADLANIAGRLCTLLKRTRLDRSRKKIGISVSVGATLAQPDDTVVSILKRADSLMYRSKQEGGARATVDGSRRKEATRRGNTATKQSEKDASR